MDQIKTGKLIAKLRKEKGMTQQELADIFNINYRSVSKWETGKTMPDISNIDLLSEIFNVTSDELLKGELNNQKSSPKRRFSFPKKYLYLLIPLIILIISISYLIYRNNNSITYSIISNNKNEYYVEGSAILKNNNLIININKILFNEKDFNKLSIKRYNYDLYLNNYHLYTYRNDDTNSKKIYSIRDFSNIFSINHGYKIKKSQDKIEESNLILTITFIDENDNEITKDIIMSISPKNNENSSST